jgi:hypothetical protein
MGCVRRALRPEYSIPPRALYGSLRDGELRSRRAGMFSVERLMEFLTDLGQDVEITVRPTRKAYGRSQSSWPREAGGPPSDRERPPVADLTPVEKGPSTSSRSAAPTPRFSAKSTATAAARRPTGCANSGTRSPTTWSPSSWAIFSTMSLTGMQIAACRRVVERLRRGPPGRIRVDHPQEQP